MKENMYDNIIKITITIAVILFLVAGFCSYMSDKKELNKSLPTISNNDIENETYNVSSLNKDIEEPNKLAVLNKKIMIKKYIDSIIDGDKEDTIIKTEIALTWSSYEATEVEFLGILGENDYIYRSKIKISGENVTIPEKIEYTEEDESYIINLDFLIIQSGVDNGIIIKRAQYPVEY